MYYIVYIILFIYYIDSYSIEENRQAERELNSLNLDCVDDQMNFLNNDDDDGDDGENMKA